MYRGVLTVMYGCGLRIGEAVKVTVKDIDAQRLVIRVVGKENKEPRAARGCRPLCSVTCAGCGRRTGIRCGCSRTSGAPAL